MFDSFVLLSSIPLYGYDLSIGTFIYSPIDGHYVSPSLRLLQIKLIWTCVNKIFYSHALISLGSISGSGMTGAYVRDIFDFV